MLESIDREVFLLLNGWGSPWWDAFWLTVTDKLHWIGLYLLLLFHSFKVLGWKRALFLVVGVVLLITLTDQTANLFKSGFARPRPCHNPELDALIRLVKPSCGGAYGYFSAHAANSMALAIFFGLVFRSHVRWYFVPLVFWAVLVGYSRIYIGVHYPGDVLTGFSIGALYGGLVYLGVNKLTKIWNIP